ncbi:MAG: hypothetical protein V9E83_01455 [Baekduia sp.]
MILGAVLAVGAMLAGASLRRRRESRRMPFALDGIDIADPGAERRAEQQARRFLQANTSAEEWEMYRELGIVRVWGALAEGPPQGGTRTTRAGAPYAYLIYPDAPVVTYLPQTRDLLGELTLPRLAGRRSWSGGAPSPADDVLAKLLALREDEQMTVGEADFHLPGRGHDIEQLRRDLWRLGQWEQARLRRLERERSQPAG